MNQNGGILFGLIIVALLFVPMLVVLNFSYLGSLGNRFIPAGDQEGGSQSSPASLLNQAEQTKIQANLKSISVGISAYYAQQGAYPDTLAETIAYAGIDYDTSNIVYSKCSSSSAILYHNSENYPGYILGGSSPTPTSGSIPSC